jgi:hypothetical protein
VTRVEGAQPLNYLKAAGLKRGLLINLGAASFEYERLIWGYEDIIIKSAQSV